MTLLQRALSLRYIPRLWRCTQSKKNFELLPDFFSTAEQRTLLSASLRKLDATEPRGFRRRRKEMSLSKASPQEQSSSTGDLFYPDEYYQFEEGHYDGVIRRYREMHVSSWDETASPALAAVLERLRTLFPSKSDTQTHLLHLASDGEILPHIDSVDASGSWILGVSLGAARVLRLEPTNDEMRSKVSDVLLPSGSVYLQRNSVRYGYRHSILRTSSTGRSSEAQRLSIMVRDRLDPTAHTRAL
ncbi:hypothetical protein BV25DRAFT_1868773 [Artomyces pyxidatus]|uniref:Uncharacterized protein n=1 Tax=Artomyces pyxidatus TaxID=48021 RepID=A0ACB8TBD4_9AGAM|nr:hypothetical protein BV25DRAFT_1868773 [Artomyces pyxidatus]